MDPSVSFWIWLGRPAPFLPYVVTEDKLVAAAWLGHNLVKYAGILLVYPYFSSGSLNVQRVYSMLMMRQLMQVIRWRVFPGVLL